MEKMEADIDLCSFGRCKTSERIHCRQIGQRICAGKQVRMSKSTFALTDTSIALIPARVCYYNMIDILLLYHLNDNWFAVVYPCPVP